MNYRALCFVDMPFGQTPDLKSGVVVDFYQLHGLAVILDMVYNHCGRRSRRWIPRAS